MARRAARSALLSLLLATTSCGGETEGGAPSARRGAPPPPAPSASARAGLCEGGGGKLSDPTSAPFFGAAGGFCVEAGAKAAVYGEGGSAPIKGICDLFDGECEIYFSFDVARTVDLALVAGDGSGATVQVRLSRFQSPTSAFGMYSRRVVGDGDPAAKDTMPRALEIPAGAAVLGHGNAYLVRGEHLVELLVQQDGLDEVQLKKRADAALPAIVRAIAERLPGSGELPEVVRRLPAGRVPLGERVLTKKWLVELGATPLGLGYYADGKKRFRIAAARAADDAEAKALLERLSKLPGASKDGARVRFEQAEGATKAEWLALASGAWVFAVGDEIRALGSGRDSALGADEKKAKLDRLASPEPKAP